MVGRGIWGRGVIGEEEVEGDKFWMGRSFKKGIRGQRILEEMERD